MTMTLYALSTEMSLVELSHLITALKTYAVEQTDSLFIQDCVKDGVFLWERAHLEAAGLIKPIDTTPLHTLVSSFPSLLTFLEKSPFKMPGQPGYGIRLALYNPTEICEHHLLLPTVDAPKMRPLVGHFLVEHTAVQQKDLNIYSIGEAAYDMLAERVVLEENYTPPLEKITSVLRNWTTLLTPYEKRRDAWAEEVALWDYIQKQALPATALSSTARGTMWWKKLSDTDKAPFYEKVDRILDPIPPRMLFEEGGWAASLRVYEAQRLRTVVANRGESLSESRRPRV